MNKLHVQYLLFDPYIVADHHHLKFNFSIFDNSLFINLLSDLHRGIHKEQSTDMNYTEEGKSNEK